jgi:hypothetical protein
MKKTFLFTLSLGLVFALGSCNNDDDNGNDDSNTGYPTDGLPLPEEKKALLITSYAPGSGYLFALPKLILEDLYGDQFNYLGIATAPGVLKYPIVDSIVFNQPLQPAPAFYLNDRDILPTEIADEVETAVGRRPVATVSHRIMENDTAWVIDNKIKFWRDTAGAGFFVESYLLADIPAVNYQDLGVNFSLGNQPDFIRNEDSVSVWDEDKFNLDSSRTVVKDGDPFIHPSVLITNSNPERAWGFRISEYTPFGFSFSVNDIVGTRFTPIRHYIKKEALEEDSLDVNYPFDPVFLSVIWYFNEDTGKFEYINSFQSKR